MLNYSVLNLEHEVHQVFLMSLHLNILCTSSVKQHYAEDNEKA